MGSRSGGSWLCALVVVALLVLPGCDILGQPMPVKPSENIGVDPTGATIDTTPLDPPGEDVAAEEPMTAQAPPSPRPEPRTEPQPEPAPKQYTLRKTYVPPASSSPGVRTGGSGLVHHRLAGSDHGGD